MINFINGWRVTQIVLSGVGPVIKNPVKTMVDVMNLCPFKNIYDQVPFVAKMLEVCF